MKKSKSIILLFCGIVFGLAAFPVFAQDEKPKDVVINKTPLKDFGEMVKRKVLEKELDLDKPFKVVLEGVLTKDGKFDISRDKTGKSKSQFTLTEGDEQMIDIAKSAIEAIGDSGWFIYLRNLGVEQIKLTVAQDSETFSARIESDLKNENKAKTIASGFRVLLKLVKIQSEDGSRKIDEDAMTIINGLQTPTADGTNFILNFALPKKTFHEIILRELNKTEDNKTAGE